MDCLGHFFDQVLQTVVTYLPVLLDWLVTRLKG